MVKRPRLSKRPGARIGLSGQRPNRLQTKMQMTNWVTFSVWLAGIVIAMSIGLLTERTARSSRLVRVRARRSSRQQRTAYRGNL
jgi:hypothetical protein